MLRRTLKLLLVLAIIGAIVGAVFFQRFNQSYQGYEGSEQFVELAPGDGTQVIGRKLVEAGVVRDPVTFRVALLVTRTAKRLQAGEYRFDRPLTPIQVVNKLAHGEVYLRAITFPEGLRITEMARIFESRGFGRAATFIAASRDASLVRGLDPGARNLEGYLFPETYNVKRGTGAPDLVRRMVARFEQVFSPALREEAQARGLTVRQAVTLASLVEKETSLPEERPTVAAVYLRRWRIGMALQADPTVIYALEVAGRYDGNLTKEGLSIDSPYNTYRYPGLPPGPIASPGRTSLEAVVRPAAVDYLYFVSRNDGSHEFARTLDEHNHNVYRFQVRPYRQQKAQAR